MTSQVPRDPLPPRADVAVLLSYAGIEGCFELTAIPGGANNRVCRVDVEGRFLLLKQYFRHILDGRQRSEAEWEFARYAWDRGIRAVPEPLASGFGPEMSLFEFVPGRKLAPSELVAEHIEQAARFIEALNAPPLPATAATLRTASEACYSLEEHVERVGARVGRLSRMDVHTDLDAAARKFVVEELVPQWQAQRAHVIEGSRGTLGQLLPHESRILSPSDFGFHNALCDSEGRLRFFDFEYAGWDDPAKLVCDFFCQVQVPVPRAFLPEFTSAVAALSDEPRLLHERVRLLLPVYQVKWCCIVLNEFTPEAAARRAFSCGEALPLETRKEQQLNKARDMLDRLSGRA